MTVRTRVRIIATIVLILAVLGLVVGAGLYVWERNNSYLSTTAKGAKMFYEPMEGWSMAQVDQHYEDAVVRLGEEIAEKFRLEPAGGGDFAPQLSGGTSCGKQDGFTKEFFNSSVYAVSPIYVAAPSEDWPAVKEFVRQRMAELGYETEVVIVDRPDQQAIDYYDEKNGAKASFGQSVNLLVSIESPCIRMSYEGLGEVPDWVK